MNSNGTKYTDAELTVMESAMVAAEEDTFNLGMEGCFGITTAMTAEQAARMARAEAAMEKWFQRFNL